MFWNLCVNEEKKIMKRWILWAGILLLSTIITLSMITMANSNPYPELIQRQIIWPMVLVIYLGQFAANPIAAGLILVAIASAATAQEYGWRTYSAYLSRGVPRWQLIVAKLLALVLPALLVVTILTSVITVVSGFYTAHFTGALELSKVSFVHLGFSIIVGAFSLLPYGALAILFSIIGRSLILPLIGGMGWILIEQTSFQMLNSLGEVGKSISKWLPVGINMGLLQPAEAIARDVPAGLVTMHPWERFNLLSPETAAIAAAGYVVLLTAISSIIFYKQDICN